VSGIVFYNPTTLEIAVQRRDKKTSKWVGESYSFWGGGIEQDESPEEAMLRELSEELDYTPVAMKYFGQYEYTTETEGKYKGLRIIQHVFLEEISDKLLNSTVLEGASIALIPIDKAISGEGFVEGSTKFLIDVKTFIIPNN